MSRYTAVHASPQGAGDARPTALQIVHDEGLEGKLKGKTFVITGVTSGIGIETARALSATGAKLFLTARDKKKAEVILSDILESRGVNIIEMDNSSLNSVKNAATTILEQSHGQVNIMVANAGVMGIPELQHTEDGHEVHFATNHLSHFLLFQLLKPALLASASPIFHSRVVLVASSAHRAGDLSKSEAYNFQDGGYQPHLGYANSKLANVYMANELDRRYASLGLHATSVHPGAVNTGLSRHSPPEFVDAILNNDIIVKTLKSHEQGAATTVIAAIGRDWEDNGGRYLEDCEEAKRGLDEGDMFSLGFVPHAYNQTIEQQLWKDSLRLVGIKED